jgi:enoyl-CoA hydratase
VSGGGQGSGAGASVGLEVGGGVAVLTLRHPPVNAITVAMALQMGEHLRDLEHDEQVGAVIITGAGSRAFSAGSDIREFAAMLAPHQAVDRKLRPQNMVFSYLARYAKPTIAALNGDTLGGGLEIAVCCDLIVADRSARIGSPEITLGVFPSSGGTFRVARRIGVGRAKQMQLLGLPISAETAQEWGLVNQVAETGHSLADAKVLAGILLRRPPRALALCKSVIDGSDDLSEPQLIEHSLLASECAFTSPECAEGVRAFLAKEEPAYRVGRPAPATS